MAKPSAPYIGKQGKVELDDAVFSEPFHMGLVHEAVRAELNARRRGTASTTVTRSTRPSSANTWVIPNFLPRRAAIR